MTPGTRVTWLDSSNRRHEGVVAEHPNPPLHADGRFFVIETITAEIPYWIEAYNLEVAPRPANEREGA